MDPSGLKKKLEKIDGRGYKAYRDLAGSYGFPGFTLFIDYIQGDPYASPSRMRVRVTRAAAGFEADLLDSQVRRVAFRDYLARVFAKAISSHVKGNRGTGKSGFIGVDYGGQEILERTAVKATDEFLEVRFVAGLPADGRRCLGVEAAAMLLEEVPQLVEASLFSAAVDEGGLRQHVDSAEDQDWLRRHLPEIGLTAFVADGSILPRESGVKDLPLVNRDVVAFRSPAELRVEMELPNRGLVTGMGIAEGVTLIVGGGYHGKSTLLAALERGVYSHLPGDGRDLLACRSDAVKIRAEDGRRVEKVDISPFISNLPFAIDTAAFCTENASGSTSQAANIIEAMEAGSRLLLIDEDTSATNFMIRDELMQQLIIKEKEPITPFIDQVRNLYREHGVSTIMVMGGSGDYFEVADTVIAMDSYEPAVVTGKAREIAAARRDRRKLEGGETFGPLTTRSPLAEGINPRRGGREKVAAKGLRTIMFGKQTVDLALVEQLVDRSQTRAIGDLVWYALRQDYFSGKASLAQVLDHMFEDLGEGGLEIISRHMPAGTHPGDYAMPRRFEVAAMLNRMRSFQVRQ
ncbi:MAG: ABC-ATPase domain-containing protein [Thermoleophilia bacterium]|nr:ABC-ATPase domain-containing protein [Thermoleophilia bacterium]